MTDPLEMNIECLRCKSKLHRIEYQGNKIVWAVPNAEPGDVVNKNGETAKGINASFAPCYTFEIYRCDTCGHLEFFDAGI
jgi:DNA-directed RNA polymerase subunit RPC12/RpoP